MRQHVGQDFAEHDAQRRGADAFRRRHIFEAAHLLGRGAHDDCEAVPFEQPQHQHHDPERAAHRRHHRERDQDQGHGEPHGRHFDGTVVGCCGGAQGDIGTVGSS